MLALLPFTIKIGLIPVSFEQDLFSLRRRMDDLLRRTRKSLFLVASNQTSELREHQQQAWNVSNYFIFMFGTVGYFCGTICVMFSELYLFILSAALWFGSRSFAKYTSFTL